MSTEPSRKSIPAVIAKNAGKRHREFIRKINRENKALSERVAELEELLREVVWADEKELSYYKGRAMPLHLRRRIDQAIAAQGGDAG